MSKWGTLSLNKVLVNTLSVVESQNSNYILKILYLCAIKKGRLESRYIQDVVSGLQSGLLLQWGECVSVQYAIVWRVEGEGAKNYINPIRFSC